MTYLLEHRLTFDLLDFLLDSWLILTMVAAQSIEYIDMPPPCTERNSTLTICDPYFGRWNTQHCIWTKVWITLVQLQASFIIWLIEWLRSAEYKIHCIINTGWQWFLILYSTIIIGQGIYLKGLVVKYLLNPDINKTICAYIINNYCS